jgi:hypothetical protein
MGEIGGTQEKKKEEGAGIEDEGLGDEEEEVEEEGLTDKKKHR